MNNGKLLNNQWPIRGQGEVMYQIVKIKEDSERTVETIIKEFAVYQLAYNFMIIEAISNLDHKYTIRETTETE